MVDYYFNNPKPTVVGCSKRLRAEQSGWRLANMGRMEPNGILVCKYLWVAFYLLWLVWALRTKPTRSRESAASRLSYIVPIIFAYLLMFTRHAANGWLQAQLLPDDPWIQVLGIAICVAGLLFAVWARLYLGGNWSSSVTVKVGHELIRNGPYRWVRHPIYSGLVLAMLGTAVANRQVRGVIAVILAFLGFTIKSRIEERAMTHTFGPEYEEYSRNTGGILPKLL
jgi:protein-S-isoprenylcysteine O-methyltransferase Ste14